MPKLLIRPPAVADSFYPEDPDALRVTIGQLLSKTKVVKGSMGNAAKILIVPHAGIEYSGQTAAWGFRQIQGKNYTKIILLGPSHYHWFDHAAVYPSGKWQTPLGKTRVDKTLAAKIIDSDKNIFLDMESHIQEHSLELELIFLQSTLKNFQIAPILISNPNEELIENLSQKIAKNFDAETLLVISSDLCHYPPYKTAQEVDKKTIKAILSGRETVFTKALTKLSEQNYPGLETPACGQEAIKIGLRVGEILGMNNYQEIFYQNSGDVNGDHARVVGYAAIIGWGRKTKTTNTGGQFSKKAQREALSIARKTLESYLENGEIPKIKVKSAILQQPLGAFVTLRENNQLRGCIGLFEPNKPLWKTIQEMSIAAAAEDPRFPPVTADELENIKIEISVMTPKKKISDWRKIRLGIDGVVISKNGRTGVFLPQVATETGWTLEEFLSQLCSQKAGLPPNCYQDPDISIYTFQAQVLEEK